LPIDRGWGRQSGVELGTADGTPAAPALSRPQNELSPLA